MEYIVQPGDTLWSIAARFGTTVQAIMQANRLADPSYIYSGLRLFIPVTGQPPSFPPFPPSFPPIPPGGDRDLERRVTRLERQVERLSNDITRLDRRLDRLEGQGPRT